MNDGKLKNYGNLIDYIYNNIDKYENTSLILEKLIKNDIIEQPKNKSKFFRNRNITKIPKIVDNLPQRVTNQVESLEKLGYRNMFNNESNKCLNLKTSSRLVVGLGGGHVLETSLTLHHIFGIPYIPATALKGVVRMLSFWEIAENRNKRTDKEIEELQKQIYDDISGSEDEDILRHKLLFGTQNFKGLLVFLDAYPDIQNTQEIFDVDVMNPHYFQYYTKEETPGDWENPIPIVFLTVKKGIPFCFNVLFDESRTKEILNKENSFKETKKIKKILNQWLNNFPELTNFVNNLLKSALEEYGLGAKTRVGYGRFE